MVSVSDVLNFSNGMFYIGVVMNEQYIVEILDSIKSDVSLVEHRLRDWWLQYLLDARERYIELYHIVKHFLQNNTKILDVGCIPGHFTVLLRKLGYNVICVDINPSRADSFLKKYDVEVYRVDVVEEPLPFYDNSFDIVLFTEVVEHIPDPLHPLNEIYRVLRKNGVLILSTPAFTLGDRMKILWGLGDNNFVKELRKKRKIGHYGHIRKYLPRELELLLREAGFKNVKILFVGKPIMSLKQKIVALLLQGLGRKRLFMEWFCKRYYAIGIK